MTDGGAWAQDRSMQLLVAFIEAVVNANRARDLERPRLGQSSPLHALSLGGTGSLGPLRHHIRYGLVALFPSLSPTSSLSHLSY